jgi:hypothetical protein
VSFFFFFQRNYSYHEIIINFVTCSVAALCKPPGRLINWGPLGHQLIVAHEFHKNKKIKINGARNGLIDPAS